MVFLVLLITIELISININTLETKSLGNWLENNVNDILLCDVEPKNIYTISENKYLHYYKTNSDGLELIEKTPINLTAHTISEFWKFNIFIWEQWIKHI